MLSDEVVPGSKLRNWIKSNNLALAHKRVMAVPSLICMYWGFDLITLNTADAPWYLCRSESLSYITHAPRSPHDSRHLEQEASISDPNTRGAGTKPVMITMV